MDAAWRAGSCDETLSAYCALRVLRLRASLRREISASRVRRSRDCWREVSESVMRVKASLSGWILKLPIVW